MTERRDSLRSVPPPALSVDAPRSRRFAIVFAARVFVFGVTAVALGVVTPDSLVGKGGSPVGWASATACFVLITSLFGVWFVRGGRRLREFALAQIFLDQALTTFVVFLTGGVVSGATSLYGVICLLGGLMLGVQGVFAASLAGGVFFSLMVLLVESGSLAHPSERAHGVFMPSDQTTYYVVVNLLVLVLVALLASYLSERLERASGALAEAETRAAEAERLAALGQIAAGLAHEIRNPLSSIAGAVQLLQTSVDHPEDRELCDIVRREAGRLEDLVSDMVDLSRPRPPHVERTDVSRVVDDVAELARRSGRALGDVSVVRLGTKEPSFVLADSGQLRQLVWNLVRNAVQASVAGGEVRVRLDSDQRVVLSVEDDGVGIDAEARAQIFDAFYTTRSKGTGVGLAVVKRIADDHGFTVAVESDAGRGATFLVDLGPPLAPAE